MPAKKSNKTGSPTKTLTQRRSNPESSSNEPIRYSSLSSNKSSSAPPGSMLSSYMNQGQDSSGNESEGGSTMKIVIWAVVILAAGIGLALLVRNMTKDDETDTADTTESEEETVDEETEDTTEEEAEDLETPEETAEEEEEATEEETTEETTATTVEGLENEYSKDDQTISDGLTTNAITITGYTYFTYSANFLYTIKLGSVSQYPGVTATLDETAKTLTVVVSNVKTDSIVGNGGSGTTTFAGNGNANTVDISNTSGKTTYVFNLDKATDYKINAVDGEEYDSIQVDIKNS